MFDQKIVLQAGTTDKYGFAVLNPDGSLVGGGASGTTMYTMVISYDANANAEYVGEAPAGNLAGVANPVWRIKKFTYDVNENVTSVAWADGDTDFDNIWANRAALSYS